MPNRTPGGIHIPTLGLVLHVIEGSLAAADSVFHNPSWQASAHFGVGKDGTLWQWVDTNDKAWAEVAGNGSYHSVETEGWSTEPLTPQQVGTLARLYRWGMDAYGWPARVTDTPGTGGLITHGDGGAAWGGHTSCPGPQRSAQRGAIVAAAAGGPAPGPAPAPPPPSPAPQPVAAAPPWPGRSFRYPPFTNGPDVRQWQQRMSDRGWAITVDGSYGPQSRGVCLAFQREKGLAVDGVVGPATWAAAWTAPVT